MKVDGVGVEGREVALGVLGAFDRAARDQGPRAWILFHLGEAGAKLVVVGGADDDGHLGGSAVGQAQADEVCAPFVSLADAVEVAVGDDCMAVVGGVDEAFGGVDDLAGGSGGGAECDGVGVGDDTAGVVERGFAQAAAHGERLVAAAEFRGAVVTCRRGGAGRGGACCCGGRGGWVVQGDSHDGFGTARPLDAFDAVGVGIPGGCGRGPGDLGAALHVVVDAAHAEVGVDVVGVEGGCGHGCGAGVAFDALPRAYQRPGAVVGGHGLIGVHTDGRAGVRVQSGQHVPDLLSLVWGMWDGPSVPTGAPRPSGCAHRHHGRIRRPGAGLGGSATYPRGHRRTRHAHLRPVYRGRARLSGACAGPRGGEQ